MKSRHHDEAMSELYRSDPALALEVINDILAEGDQACPRDGALSFIAFRTVVHYPIWP